MFIDNVRKHEPWRTTGFDWSSGSKSIAAELFSTGLDLDCKSSSFSDWWTRYNKIQLLCNGKNYLLNSHVREKHYQMRLLSAEPTYSTWKENLPNQTQRIWGPDQLDRFLSIQDQHRVHAFHHSTVVPIGEGFQRADFCCCKAPMIRSEPPEVDIFVHIDGAWFGNQ